MINRGWNPRAHQPKGLATPKWVELKYGNKWLKAIFISSRGNVPGLIGIMMNKPCMGGLIHQHQTYKLPCEGFEIFGVRIPEAMPRAELSCPCGTRRI